MKNKETGRRGETIARAYLEKRGFRIVAANWRYRCLEIDIIATKENAVIFFEVKTRSARRADGNIPLSKKQVGNLKTAIAAYCLIKKVRLERTRLDLIMIEVDQAKKAASLRHYPDVF